MPKNLASHQNAKFRKLQSRMLQPLVFLLLDLQKPSTQIHPAQWINSLAATHVAQLPQFRDVGAVARE